MKRTIAYIDGYNLYYGLLKGTPWKWLDLVKFIKSLLREDHEIVAVKYFTAPVKTYPYDAAAVERQNVYLQALETLGIVKVQLGFYNKNATYFPVHDEPCISCETAKKNHGMIRVVKLEEKQSDVNIASAMILDAVRNAADSFVLVSGDTDFITPLTIVRKDFKKGMLVFNPHTRRSDLEKYASYYKDIPRDLPAKCQLPYEIPVGTHGNVIRCPEKWREAQ